MMNTQHTLVTGFQQPSVSTTSKQIARKLNFQIDSGADGKSTGLFHEIRPLSWRNVCEDGENQDLEPFTCVFTGSGPQISPGLVLIGGRGPHNRPTEPNTESSFLCDSSSLDPLDYEHDDVSDIMCRGSNGFTNVLNSSVSPEERKELSHSLCNLTDGLVDLNLKQPSTCNVGGESKNCFKLKHNAEKETNPRPAPKIKFYSSSSSQLSCAHTNGSRSDTRRFTATKIKFPSASFSEQICANTNSDTGLEKAMDLYKMSDLAPISHMLRTCEVFHPLDMEPREPYPSPEQSPVRSLMDGGDAVDVRGLANRLAYMKSECSMRDALTEYMHTHVPDMQGKMDAIIENTVQQIADVSLRDGPSNKKVLAEITTTRDWLDLQNGVGLVSVCAESKDCGIKNTSFSVKCDYTDESRDTQTSNGFTSVTDNSKARQSQAKISDFTDSGIVELDKDHIKHHCLKSSWNMANEHTDSSDRYDTSNCRNNLVSNTFQDFTSIGNAARESTASSCNKFPNVYSCAVNNETSCVTNSSRENTLKDYTGGSDRVVLKTKSGILKNVAKVRTNNSSPIWTKDLTNTSHVSWSKDLTRTLSVSLSEDFTSTSSVTWSNDFTTTSSMSWSKNFTSPCHPVAEVRCAGGGLVHCEYISPEEHRYTSYAVRKGKRKIREVEGGAESSPGQSRPKGKKRVAFAFLDEECKEPEVIRFKNGSWD